MPKVNDVFDADYSPKTLSFGEDKKAKIKQRTKHRNPIPLFDHDYIIGEDVQTQEVLEELVYSLKEKDSILLVGPPGVGKSTIAKQLASLLNWGLVQKSCHANMSEKDIFGKWSIDGDKMVFIPDTGLEAYSKGMLFLADEFDFLNPEVISSAHDNLLAPPSDNHYYEVAKVNPKNGKPILHKFKRHKDYRFIGTCNTIGRGDDSNMYHGTRFQNEATLDRLSIIKVDFHGEETEVEILTSKTNINQETASKMREVASECRSRQEDLSFVFSLRKLLKWAKWSTKIGFVRSTRKLYNELNRVDAEIVSNIIKTYFQESIEPE